MSTYERGAGASGPLPPKPRYAPALGTGNAFVCPRCGARSETDAVTARCQFCAAGLVPDPQLTERVVPEAVVPFWLGRDAARDALRRWTFSRWFAPGSLKQVTEAETFRGSYLPYWMYDARTTSSYQGQRGAFYYVNQTSYSSQNGQIVATSARVRRTAWQPASGTVHRDFGGLLVPGTRHVSTQQLDELAPWPLHEARPYQAEFLGGFQTVRYDVEPEQALDTAKQRMAVAITSDCRADIGGDDQQVASVDTRYADLGFKLVLLPVWFLSYPHAGQSWQVMVNARTGEVIGDRPYSGVKITAAFAALVALLFVLVFAVT